MLFLISPAKTLDYNPSSFSKSSKVRLADESLVLIQELKKYKSSDIKELMGVSDKIADLNYGRFQAFSEKYTSSNSKQAILAFKGDVYTGMEADTFNKEQMDYAQKHIRILSGLYGLLRPLDKMQPYRLEMGTRLPTGRGKNLYDYWGSQIADLINKDLKANKSKILINLASKEYYKSVDQKALKADVYNMVFKDYKNGKLKIIAFFAKKARGMMCKYAALENISTPEDLKGFNYADYGFSEEHSSEREYVFVR